MCVCVYIYICMDSPQVQLSCKSIRRLNKPGSWHRNECENLGSLSQPHSQAEAMNMGFSAVLSCFYRKYRWWHLCLKQLATAPFFLLKFHSLQGGGTPQVLSWGTLGPSPVQEPPVGFTGEGWGSASCALTQPGTALPPGEALNVQVPLPPALLFPEFPNAQSTPFSSSAASSARADGCSDGCPATLGVARAS